MRFPFKRRRQWLDEQHGPGSGAAILAENAAEEAAAAAALGVKRVGTVDDLQCLDEDLEAGRSAKYAYSHTSLLLEICHDGNQLAADIKMDRSD